jgi:hypothetical protein
MVLLTYFYEEFSVSVLRNELNFFQSSAFALESDFLIILIIGIHMEA